MRTGDIWTRIPGTATPPVVQTFDNVRVYMPSGGEPSVGSISNVYFGSSGSTSGLYSVQATFLAAHPGLTLQNFLGYVVTPPGFALVPASFPGTFTSTGNFDTTNIPVGQDIHENPIGTAVLEWGYSGGASPQTIAVLTFTPGVNSVGFTCNGFGQPLAYVEFRNGVTVLATSPNLPSLGTTFVGYSSAT